MTDVVLGVVAAAIAVLLVHEPLIALFHALHLTTLRAYSLAAVPPLGVPTIVNRVFWGGVWGAVYALTQDYLPEGPAWAKGMLFGWLIFFLVNCLALPVIKDEPIFYGINVTKLATVFTILSVFGLALAVVYRALGGT